MCRKTPLLLLLAVFVSASWFFDFKDGTFGQASVAEAEESVEVPFSGTVIASSGLNVRSGPDTSYEQIGQLSNGQIVEVTKVHADWYEIDYSSDTGFIHSSYVVHNQTDTPEESLEEDEPTEEQEMIATAQVTHSNLAVRETPDSSKAALAFLTMGDEVEIYGYHEDGPWVQIAHGDGYAYTHSDYLDLKDEDGSQEEEEENLEVIAVGEVTHSNLAVRETPNSSEAALAFLTTGDEVEIYGYHEDGPWVQIAHEDGYAYTHSDYLDLKDEDGSQEEEEASFEVIAEAEVTHERLHVRENAGGSNETIGQLTAGDVVEIYDYVNGGPWVMIGFNGEYGYTHSDHLNIKDDDDSPEEEASFEVIAEGEVTHERLHVRENAGGSSSTIGHLSSGDVVEIYEYVNDGPWVMIGFNGEHGYTHSDHLNIRKPGDEVVRIGQVTHNSLQVREAPGASSEAIGTLAVGEQVDIYAYHDGGPWVRIDYNGGYAYTHSDHMIIRRPGEGVLSGKTIVVDAGHGGNDPGASGNGLVEKNVNLDVAKELQSRLASSGANVVMTRTGDYFLTLQERVQVAERANADLFVSIHANAFTSTARGAETFWNSTHAGGQSRQIASLLQNRIVNDTGMNHRRVDTANFYVIRHTTMPSTLVELGFLTNSGDASIMRQPGYAAKAGESLHQGVLEFYQ